MDREKAKKRAEAKMDKALAQILLDFEAEMCRIWETDNHHKNHKLRLICEYTIKNKNKVETQTDIEVLA